MYVTEAWGRRRTEPCEIATCVFWAERMQQTTKAKRKQLRRTKSEWERSPESREKWISIRKRWLALSSATEWSQIDWEMCLPFGNWRGYWRIESRPSRLFGVEIMWQWFENWMWSDYLETLYVEWWQNLEDKTDPRKLSWGWGSLSTYFEGNESVKRQLINGERLEDNW